jgi:hypothetical protein
MSYASRVVGVVASCCIVFLPFLTACSGAGGGTAGPPNVVVLVDGAAVPVGGVDFGSPLYNAETVDKELTVKNAGESTLEISGYVLTTGGSNPDEFTFVGSLPSVIAAGGQASIIIHYAPVTDVLSTEERRETVTVTSNDPDESSYSFEVYGTAHS